MFTVCICLLCRRVVVLVFAFCNAAVVVVVHRAAKLLTRVGMLELHDVAV